MASDEERFFAKVSQPETCWLWTGSLDSHGYGQFGLGRRGRRCYAHRWAYEYLRGEIPMGLELDHLCREPACVNPWHLEPVTHLVNVQRGRASEVMKARYAEWTCKAGHSVAGENAYLWTMRTGYIRKQCRACKAAVARRAKERKVSAS